MKYSTLLTLFTSMAIALVLFSFLPAHAPQQLYTSGTGNIQVAVPSSNATAQSQEYNVTFHEYGLPSGMYWSVTINKITKTTENETMVFFLSNGSYSYGVKSVNGYYSPQAGSISVGGKNTEITLSFSAINSPSETLQLFLEGLGFGGIIGGIVVSSVMKRRSR